MTSPGASSVGTSFAEWTARSTARSRSAATIRPTNAPSPHDVSTGRSSPSVRMTTRSVGIWCSARRAATNLAWTSASGLPRVPMRSVRVTGPSRSQGEQLPRGVLELARVVVAEPRQRRMEQTGDQPLAHLDDEVAFDAREVGAPEEPIELLGAPRLGLVGE